MAKIMLVEDDNNLREIYGARLMAEGYEIVSAQDGEEALAIAVKEKPDLIISDVMMPRISGFDMLDILRNAPETKDTKVIMMTALSQAEDKSRADKLGADRYLVKSQVTLEDVTNTVHEVLGDVPSDSPAPTTTPATETAETTQAQNPAPATETPAAATPAPTNTLSPAPAATEAPTQSPVTAPTVENIANPDIKVVDEPNPGEIQAPPAPETAPPAPATSTPAPGVQTPVIPAPNPAQFQPQTTTPPATPTANNASPTAPADPQTSTPLDQTASTAPPAASADNSSSSTVSQSVTDTTDTTNTTSLPPVVEPGQTDVVKPEDIKVELPDQSPAPTPAPVTDSTSTAPTSSASVDVPEVPQSQPAAPEATEPSVGPNLAEALAAEEQQLTSDKSNADSSPASTPSSTAPNVANGAPAPTVVTPTKIEVSSPPEETAADSEANNPSTPNKKATGERVIQPLNDPDNKPDLQALLAAEEQKDAVSNPAANSVIPPQEPKDNSNKSSTDLNNIAI